MPAALVFPGPCGRVRARRRALPDQLTLAVQFEGWPILFAQFTLEKFSGAGFREAGNELNGFWTLVVGEPRTTEFDQFGLAGGGVGLEDDDRLWDFAPSFIWDRNDGGFVDVGVRREHLLHLKR